MFRWKYFFTLFLCISMHLSATGGCPTQLWDQKITCGPGKAISNIAWSEEGPKCRKYQIVCQNATDSCIENCTWNVNCLETSRNVIGHTHQYVRGIHVFYDQITDRQTEGALVATFCRNHSYVPLCPLDAMKSTVVVNTGAFRLAGLAGLAGLSGLALINCCCADPSVITCTPGCIVCPKCLGDGTTHSNNPTGCADAVEGNGHITGCLYFDEVKAPIFGLAVGHYCDFWTGAFGG